MRTISIIALITLLISSVLAETPETLLARANQLRTSGVLMESVKVYEEYLKQVPNDIDTRLQLIQILQDLKQKEKASVHIRYLLKEAPNDPRVAALKQVEQGIRAKKQETNIADYEERIKKPDVSPKTVLDFARYLGGSGMPTRSAQVYEKYLRSRPDDMAVRLEYAKLLGWNHHYSASTEQLNIILSAQPSNTSARMFLGDLSFWQGDEDKALEIYRRVLSIDPKNAKAAAKIYQIVNQSGYKEKQLTDNLRKDPQGTALTALANYYYENDRIYEADSLLVIRLRTAPDDSEATRLKHSVMVTKLKMIGEQTEQLRRRLHANPSDSAAVRQLARLLVSIPDLTAAIELYNDYISHVPQDYFMRLDRARVLNWTGKTAESLEEMRNLANLMPGNREANIGLAYALIANNEELAEAESILRQDSIAHPTDVVTLNGLAEARRKRGFYVEAKSLYNRILLIDSLNIQAKQGLELLDKDLTPIILSLESALKKQPDSFKVRRRLAGLYVDAKRYYEAKEQVTILLDQNPEDTYLRTLSAEINRKLTEANALELVRAQQLILDKPDNLDYRIAYAQILAANDKHGEAASQYKFVVERRPADDNLQFKMALELTADKQFEEAQKIYHKIADATPQNFEYRYSYAQALSWAGKYDDAILEFERALRLKPESEKAQLALANCYLWKGDSYGAYDMYGKVLASNPQNKDARKAIATLNGPLMRGFIVGNQVLYDNSDYMMREEFGMVVMSFALPIHAKVGGGAVDFHQNGFQELGWSIMAGGDYTFDKYTTGNLLIKGYQFAVPKIPTQLVLNSANSTFRSNYTTSFRAEVTHEFSEDLPELRGMKGRAYYSNQDAIFDLASTRELQTYYRDLRTDRLGVSAKYTIQPKWKVEGEASFLGISDNNNRTELWVESGYTLSKVLTLGARYESIAALRTDSSYWAPKQYTTLSVWFMLKNSFPKWNYYFKAGTGQVQNTSDAIRNMTGGFQWHASRYLDAELSYSYLRTMRTDGEYWYQGFATSFTINL